MTYSEAVTRRILYLCKREKLNINQLAEMSGLRQSTVDSILKGKSKNPGSKTLYKIASGFSMTLSEFYDFNEMNNEEFSDVDLNH